MPNSSIRSRQHLLSAQVDATKAEIIVRKVTIKTGF